MSAPRTRPPAFMVGRLSLPSMTTVNSRVWPVLAAAAVVLNAVVTGIIALANDMPAFAFDEVHHLLMARMVAGFPAPDGSGAGYYPLWGVLLAPIWWLWDDPQTVYGIALGLGWAIGVATIWPLSLLVRRMRLNAPRAVFVAAIVMTLPARAVQADVVLSERVVFVCAVVAALAAFRLWEQPTVVRALLFALAVGMLHFSHVRMLTVVLASAVWLLAFFFHRWRIAIVGLASLAASYALFDWLGARLDAALRRTEGTRGSGFLRKLVDIEGDLLVRAALGQAWEQTIGSLGLFAIGIAALGYWCWREVRRGCIGRACWLAGSLVTSTIVSVLTWSRADLMQPEAFPRLDAWLYGRYIDPVTGILCALGLALVVRGLRRRVWVAAFTASVMLFALVARFVAPIAPVWGTITPVHVGGITPWAWLLPDTIPDGLVVMAPIGAGAFWFWPSVATLVALGAALALRRRPAMLAALLLVAVAAASVGVQAAAKDYRTAASRDWASAEPLRAVAAEVGGVEIAYNYPCKRYRYDTGVGMNQLSFALLPNATLTPYFSPAERPDDATVILSCTHSTHLAELGGRRLAGFEMYSSVAWIMPGPLQDRLDADGRLAD